LAHKSTESEPAARYLGWARLLGYEQLSELMTDTLLVASAPELVNSDLNAHLAQLRTAHFTDGIAWTDLRRVVAENFNMRVDKMSMAMSIEARSPFEDYEMVELAFSLPLEYKLRGGDFKRILKDAVRDLVPTSVLDRPKWGFNPPQSEWLRTCLRPLLGKVLSSDYVAAVGCFQPQAVQKVVHAHVVERKYELWAVWSMLSFHLWHALFIDQSLKLDHKLSASDIWQAAASAQI
jgi:asparagine synthase (glutamine-hydrolysing)